ncbi:helix-turn-helix domain-containing protein [Nonomuraea wenchangensis]
MNLNITPDLVTELYEYGQQTGRPAETALILTSRGWDTTVVIGGRGIHYDGDPTLTPLTAQGIYDWLDGNEMDDDCAAALAQPDMPGSSYRIPDEYGDYDTTPNPRWDVHVVTGTTDERGDTVHDWQDAFWFDANQAEQIIAPGKTGHSLWRTTSGRWLDHHEGDWTEVPMTHVAEWAYSAREDDLAGEPNEWHPLVSAARAARQLADAFTVPKIPTVPTGYFDQVESRPKEVLDEAADVVLGIPAITEHLLKKVVLPDLRNVRSLSADIVVEAFDGNQSAAARHLGMSQSTLNKMLPQPPEPDPLDYDYDER